jgi:hypothetical protein
MYIHTKAQTLQAHSHIIRVFNLDVLERVFELAMRRCVIVVVVCAVRFVRRNVDVACWSSGCHGRHRSMIVVVSVGVVVAWRGDDNVHLDFFSFFSRGLGLLAVWEVTRSLCVCKGIFRNR